MQSPLLVWPGARPGFSTPSPGPPVPPHWPPSHGLWRHRELQPRLEWPRGARAAGAPTEASPLLPKAAPRCPPPGRPGLQVVVSVQRLKSRRACVCPSAPGTRPSGCFPLSVSLSWGCRCLNLGSFFQPHVCRVPESLLLSAGPPLQTFRWPHGLCGWDQRNLARPPSLGFALRPPPTGYPGLPQCGERSAARGVSALSRNVRGRWGPPEARTGPQAEPRRSDTTACQSPPEGSSGRRGAPSTWPS